MNGSVYDADITVLLYYFRVKTHFQNLIEEEFIGLFPDNFNTVFPAVEFYFTDRFYFTDFIDYPIIMRSNNLTSIVPVSLESVIFRRIM